MVLLERRHLCLLAALLWGVAGGVVSTKGVLAYACVASQHLWYLLPITAVVMAGFFFMFRRIVAKYVSRIESLPACKVALKNIFPLRGWLLMSFMMGLGMALGAMPDLPIEFVASFYSGLGAMLLLSAAKFALRAR